MMTLGFLCVLLQLNIWRFYAVLYPLCFMKFYAATCWLFGWLTQAPVFPSQLPFSILPPLLRSISLRRVRKKPSTKTLQSFPVFGELNEDVDHIRKAQPR
ncbi:MAG: hypothetical protein GY822_26175 [Deltaproteobacteria bacterium]|nr:hypothetical protein [Deltaproteobacteria bacterium]